MPFARSASSVLNQSSLMWFADHWFPKFQGVDFQPVSDAEAVLSSNYELPGIASCAAKLFGAVANGRGSMELLVSVDWLAEHCRIRICARSM